MPSDPTKPLLRLTSGPERQRPAGRAAFIPSPDPFGAANQRAKFGPKFRQLAEVLGRDGDPLELRADPAALAPERLLVFEVRGAIAPFANAIRKIPGLELIDEEELAEDEDDKGPIAYLLMPNVAALQQLESLWRRWLSNKLIQGETPWRDVFALLRDLRPWGPNDRVQKEDADELLHEIGIQADDVMIRLEIELIFRSNQVDGDRAESEVRAAVAARDGRVISRSRLDDIAYHALLVDLPVWAVRQIADRQIDGVAGLEPVMYIRPQSIAALTGVADETESGTIEEITLGSPILALLDGVPVAAHPLLRQHVIVDDQFGLEPTALVANREHGTAMSSLIIHGDRNFVSRPLPRQIHVVPVLGNGDVFPADRLIVDLIYLAVHRMRDGANATAPNVVIVNLSLGNKRRPFHGQLSAWARLLDRISYQFGILFLVSAGNVTSQFEVPSFATRTAFEDAVHEERATCTLQALGNIISDRRLLSPGETVNGVTVGAHNADSVSPACRSASSAHIEPYAEVSMSNPSSALGPGFARSVKPDILMPGARERLLVVGGAAHVVVVPAGASRSAGLQVAAPPRDGRENLAGYTNGTSAATALASRTCHRIHDALEDTYGDVFTNLPHIQRAALLKALLVHPAIWPEESAAFIRSIIGPADGRQHVKQKDNIRRFLGFGMVDGDEAVACAEDRATFWATGQLNRDRITTIQVPLPQMMNGQARLHSLSATVAWFTPVSPGRKSYRTCRLQILNPEELDGLAVKAHGDQPDKNQTNRGTVFTRCWKGNRAPVIAPNAAITLTIQRDPDQGSVEDGPVPFGVAVSVAMPGLVGLYEEVRQRLQPQVRA
jgi:Subtilase family